MYEKVLPSDANTKSKKNTILNDIFFPFQGLHFVLERLYLKWFARMHTDRIKSARSGRIRTDRHATKRTDVPKTSDEMRYAYR